jgi:paired amphipathic helix protein Sin3a
MFVYFTIFCLTLTFYRQAEVFAKVEDLFKDAPDLSSAFRDFLPGAGSVPDSDSLGMLRGPSMRTGTLGSDNARTQKRKQPAEPAPASASAPAKRRRKAADRDKDKDKDKDKDAGRASGSRVSVCLVFIFGSRK